MKGEEVPNGSYSFGGSGSPDAQDENKVIGILPKTPTLMFCLLILLFSLAETTAGECPVEPPRKTDRLFICRHGFRFSLLSD